MNRVLAWGRHCAVAAALLIATLGATPLAAAQRMTGLQVDIWPEYDRREAVLVILKGELAPDIALPATVSLRLPASSDLTAVAFATAPGSQLFNLPYERTQSGSSTTVQFKTSHRLMHIEFYERLTPDRDDRRFAYVWPGDLAVDRLTVRLQEPATASGIRVMPELGAAVPGPDGLAYRTAELGAFDAGKRLPIEVAYNKRDSRTSSEILGQAPTAEAQSDGFIPEVPAWLLIVAGVAAVLLGIAAFLMWRVRMKTLRAGSPGAAFCARCGRSFNAGDRFCASCGAPLRESRKQAKA